MDAAAWTPNAGDALARTITRMLIANRGEIVVRIARTAHRLGISTVGVYSEPDADAMHVDAVDLAVALGGFTPGESYLNTDAIIEAALAHRCQAVHPGYGFLAENAEVAERIAAAGLIWIGPTPEQIRLLGDKIAAKRRAIDAGIPTAPLIEVGGDGSVLSADIPLPALVKAAFGGGGRGMRIVRSHDELAEAIAAGSREAESAFGDGTVFIEPYIERARHVEVQIIGDQHGNVVHLGERECSIQRRNQKIVEESPSPGITAETRTAICEGAVKLARSVGYHGAGTVEFLVGESGTPDQINFLEVNTRLQVEHPVTEAVTEVDLVELQLRVAAGEVLPITQRSTAVRGHAIEVRVVAEDPTVGWLPSTGTITAFKLAESDELVRVDTGVRAGAVVSTDYDSMLAKVIAHAPTRAGAAAKLGRALRSAEIGGVVTNVTTLIALLNEKDYLDGVTPTVYLDEHPEVVVSPGPDGDDRIAHLLAAVFAGEAARRRSDTIAGFAPSGWRNLRTRGQRSVWQLAGTDEETPVEYTMCRNNAIALIGPWPSPTEDGSLSADDRRRVDVRLFRRHADRATTEVAIELEGVRRLINVTVGDGDEHRTHSAVGTLVWREVEPFVDHDATAEGDGPVCPLPGTVIAVHVKSGQSVGAGDVLMVVEAMKMEHKITASAEAIVVDVHFASGDRVDQGDLLVSLEGRSIRG